MKNRFIQTHPGTWFYRPNGEYRDDALHVSLPGDKRTFRVYALEYGQMAKVCPINFRTRKAAQQWAIAYAEGIS